MRWAEYPGPFPFQESEAAMERGGLMMENEEQIVGDTGRWTKGKGQVMLVTHHKIIGLIFGPISPFRQPQGNVPIILVDLKIIFSDFPVVWGVLRVTERCDWSGAVRGSNGWRVGLVTRGCGFESRLRQELLHDEMRLLSKAPNPRLLPGIAHCSRCVCVCVCVGVSTAPGVCCVCVCVCVSTASRCVCVCVCVVSTAPGVCVWCVHYRVCALGWVKAENTFHCW